MDIIVLFIEKNMKYYFKFDYSTRLHI